MITKDKLTAVVMTLAVWALAGGLCGALYAGLQPVMSAFGPGPQAAPVGAAAAAAMTTAAFYSAMPIALVGTMAAVLVSIAGLIVGGPELGLAVIAGAAAVGGLAAGGFFAWMAVGSERPLARTLAGLLGGLIAGAAVVGLTAVLGGPVETLARAALVVALVGTLYEVSVRWLGRGGRPLVPQGMAAAVVAGLIAAMVAAAIWLLGGTPTLAYDGTSHDLLGQVRRELSPGLFGGILGGGLTGVVLELLGFRLEEHTS